MTPGAAAALPENVLERHNPPTPPDAETHHAVQVILTLNFQSHCKRGGPGLVKGGDCDSSGPSRTCNFVLVAPVNKP